MTESEKQGRFRKKPVEVEAIRWTGDNIEAVTGWLSPVKPEYMSGFSNADDLIRLPGGVAVKGDWIVRTADVDGSILPCSHDDFEATYEPV